MGELAARRGDGLHRPVRQPVPSPRASGWRLDVLLRRARDHLTRSGGAAGAGRRAAPRRGASRRAAPLAAGEPALRVRRALPNRPGSCSAPPRPESSGCRLSATGSTATSSTGSRACRRRRRSRSSSDAAGCAGTSPIWALRSAGRSVYPPDTCSATCPTSGFRGRTRRWTSTPGSRSGSARSGGRSTPASTCRGSAGCPIGQGRDAVDVAMVTTYGAATLRRMTCGRTRSPDDAELAAAEPGDRWGRHVGESLGDLIATLGSDRRRRDRLAERPADHRPDPAELRLRVPGPDRFASPAVDGRPARLPRRPAARDPQDPGLGLQRRHRALLRHVRQRRPRLQRRTGRARRSSSRPGRSSSARPPSTARTRPTRSHSTSASPSPRASRDRMTASRRRGRAP